MNLDVFNADSSWKLTKFGIAKQYIQYQHEATINNTKQ